MAQFGMQMPAGRRKGSTFNVYTGLALVACLALTAAVAVMFMFASRVGKDGQAWKLQESGKIQLPKQSQ